MVLLLRRRCSTSSWRAWNQPLFDGFNAPLRSTIYFWLVVSHPRDCSFVESFQLFVIQNMFVTAGHLPNLMSDSMNAKLLSRRVFLLVLTRRISLAMYNLAKQPVGSRYFTSLLIKIGSIDVFSHQFYAVLYFQYSKFPIIFTQKSPNVLLFFPPMFDQFVFENCLARPAPHPGGRAH